MSRSTHPPKRGAESSQPLRRPFSEEPRSAAPSISPPWLASRLWAGGVFLLALAVRLGYLLSIRHTPPGEILLIDSETYDRFARLILAGAFKGEDVYAMNVLYPYFLAATYAVGGGSWGAALVAQAFLDASTCVLVYWIGRRLFGPGTALLAGLVAAFYAPLVFYSGALLTPTLVTFLATATLFLLLLAQDRPCWWLAVLAGLTTGLATLGRGNHLLLLPLGFVFFWVAVQPRRRAIRHWLAFAAGAVLAITPTIARNYWVERRWVPVAANYAAFYIGHNAEATGLYAMPSFTESARFESEVWGTRDAVAKKLGRPVTLAESAGYLFREGAGFMLRHPAAEAKLALKKFYFFWNRTESPTNLSYYLARDFSPFLRSLPFHFGIVAPFALLGLFLSRRQTKRFLLLYLFVGLYLLTCLLFFVSAEYRLAAVPAVILLAAWAVVGLVQSVRDRGNVKVLLAALAVLAVGGVFVNVRSPLMKKQSWRRVDYLNCGRVYLDRADYDKARTMLQKSLAIDPNYGLAYESMAVLNQRLGNELEAAHMAQLARRFAAGASPVAQSAPAPAAQDRMIELGKMYQAGRYADALAGFEVLQKDPTARSDSALALSLLNNIGLCHYKLRDLVKAEATFNEILRLSPRYVKAYNNLALVREAQGRLDDAAAAYSQALEIDPQNAVARDKLARLQGPRAP